MIATIEQSQDFGVENERPRTRTFDYLKNDEIAIQTVNPSWFESPVTRLRTSGGTAPFFRLTLTDEGLEEQASRQRNQGGTGIDRNYWVGKDLSHAQDEKDFYLRILRIRSKYNVTTDGTSNRDLTEGVGLLETFMFDYMGILRTRTSKNHGNNGYCDLLVMRNLRNNSTAFRMMDLKIGEKTADAGWKGKSRFRAMKHYLMDELSNSAVEGYRLCGFNGCPEAFNSMHFLADEIVGSRADIVSKSIERTSNHRTSIERTSNHRTSIKKTSNHRTSIKQAKSVKKAKSFMVKRLDGTCAFGYFFDLHMDDMSSLANIDYLPIEVAEIVSHEFVSRLISLSTLCHRVKIPQKWIGSSVAVAYDAGFFPDRSTEDYNNQEADIRSRVLCKIFDWGRSELLTADEYEILTPEDKKDRDCFWALYKEGLDRLSYNATRFYYHQFTKSTKWTKLTIRVMDYNLMTSDDFISDVVIPLPDPSDTQAVEALNEITSYKLKGFVVSLLDSTLYCSITWSDFPTNSRLLGAWRVTIERATKLPPMDISKGSTTSDPYCIVMANNIENEYGQHFHQRTCIKARTLNPEWNESIDVPVCRTTNDSSLKSIFAAKGISSINDKEISNFFKWDKKSASRKNMNWWTNAMIGTNR